MTSLENIDGYSRVKARKIMKKLYPDMTSKQVVHHIDGNPLINDLENLMVLTIKEHKAIHKMFKLPNRIKQVREPGVKPLTIKDFPPELIDRLKAQADKESDSYHKILFHNFIIMLLDTAITEREKGESDEQ